jgi:hypothetical protein
MGSYFGIRASDGRLVAMAGERLQSTGFAEKWFIKKLDSVYVPQYG